MLEKFYKTKEEIPSGWAHLFTEKADGFYLKSGGEIKTVDDVTTLQNSLRAERTAHGETKATLGKLGGRPVDEVLADLDKIDEYKATAEAAGGDDEKLDKLLQARLKQEKGPLEREIAALKTEKDKLADEFKQLQVVDIRRTKHDAVIKNRGELTDKGLRDALFYAETYLEIPEGGGEPVTKAGIEGITAGLTAEQWLIEEKERSEHWFPESQGAGSKGSSGAGGSAGDNPWKAATWNITKQGQIMKENPERAATMARVAGTTPNGAKPIESN